MKARFIKTTSANLDSIEIIAGQLIFVEDTRSIYLDSSSGRTAYVDIIILSSDTARTSLTYPLTAFYFVVTTNILWRYDGSKWIQLTTPPTQQITFLNNEELPEEGSENMLYITNKCIYRFVDGSYIKLSDTSAFSWSDI